MRRPPVDLAKHMKEKAARDAQEARFRAALAQFQAYTSALSGASYPRDDLRERALRYAADDFVAGRVTLKQLEARIERALEK